jgi:hypothetical protein
MSKSRISALLLLLVASFARAEEIQDFTALSAAPASGDLWIVVDVSDTTDDAAGTGKIITTTNLFAYTGAFGGNAATATALAANPADCSAGQYATTIAASGALTCAQVNYSELTGTVPNAPTVTFADAGGDTTTFVALGTAATGTLAPATDAGLSYNATTDALTTTTFVGALTGNSSTATALAANGANCSAGQAPIGVDASGAVESCTAYAASDSPTFTTTVKVPDGSATVPSVAFTSDADGSGTGIYRSATNALTIANNGSGYWTFAATGALSGNASGTNLTNSVGAIFRGFLDSVEAITTTKTPGSDECGEQYTNTGDTDGATITARNDPTVGCCYRISVTAAQTLTFVFNTGETLYMGSDQCVASMTASAIGSTMEVCAAVGGSGGQWHALASAGWTCND